MRSRGRDGSAADPSWYRAVAGRTGDDAGDEDRLRRVYASPTLVGALIALALIGVVWVGGDSIRSSLRAGDEASSDLAAANSYQELIAALAEIQDERGLAELWIATGRPADRAELAEQIERSDRVLAGLGIGANGDEQASEQLSEIPDRLDRIRSTVEDRGDVAFDLYSDVIDLLVVEMGETTAGTRGSAGFAERRARDVLVDVAEDAATRRGLVVGALARVDAVDQDLLVRLSLLESDMISRITDAARLVDGELGERIARLSDSPAAGATAALISEAADPSTRAATAEDWFEVASQQIDEITALIDDLNAEDAERAERASDAARRRVVLEAVVFVGLGLAVAGLGRAAVTATRDRAVALRQHEELVAGLQQWFQPAAFAGVRGLETDSAYEPASSHARAGGDWFDVFELRNGSVLIGIGDVAGHGPEAVAQMATLRNMLRGQSMTDPAPIGEQAEHLDAAAASLGIMATLFYGVWDRTTMHLGYTRAGHLPGVLVGPSGEVCVLGGGTDTLIGVRQRTPRLTSGVVTVPRSTLVLFTDGVVESANDRIDRALDALVDDIARHARQPDGSLARRLIERRPSHHDDAAALVVRFLEPDCPAGP